MKIVFSILILSICAFGTIAQNKSLTIVDFPKPELPTDYGTLDVQGSLILRVEFLSSGKIGSVTPITKIPVRNLTELAIEAAQNIKFEPEIKNGIEIDNSRLVRYQYSWDGFWRPPLLINTAQVDEKADAIVQKAVKLLGGEKYKGVSSQIGRGNFSLLKSGVNVSVQTFVDVIVFPDKERTEFKAAGVKTVQTNTGTTGWVFDGDQELIKVQNERQVENFKRGLRTSLDNLLRGYWKGEAELTYIGRRQGTLGKRNDAIKLTYNDGFIVEFEFTADEGTPVKAMYKTAGSDGEAVLEEDRYAQFVDTQGITAPYVIDRFTNGEHISRISFLTIEYNKPIPESIFAKPSDPKQLKKDLKL